MKHIALDTQPALKVSHNPAIQKKMLLKPGDLPHLVQFAQAQFDPGQVAAAHAHKDMHEVFFVEAGHGIIIVDGEAYPLAPGVCVSVSPGEVHEVQNSGKEKLILTYFAIKD